MALRDRHAGELAGQRTPTYKEKRENQPEDVNHGLLAYPVLQAADIVLYKASQVPVGGTRLPTWSSRGRSCGRSTTGTVRPSRNRRPSTRRRRSCWDGRSPEDVEVDRQHHRDLRPGRRDPAPGHEHGDRHATDQALDPGRPEVCNVCQLHRFFGDDFTEIWDGERTARTGCVDTKKLLVERMLRHYAPARERYAELMASPVTVDRVLEEGAERLRPLAQATIAEVRENMGLR